MPNPSLSSFTNTSSGNFTSESKLNPLIAGYVTGINYSEPNFNGNAKDTSVNPGNLFGWLLYSRAKKYNPPLGATSASYIVYTTVSDLVGQLNQLGGITYALLSPSAGGTYSLFTQTSTTSIQGKTAGNEFLVALNYLAYGGTLVISGTTLGLDRYESDSGNNIEVLIGMTATKEIGNWILSKPYITGIFPSASDGSSTSMLKYTDLDSSFNGSTFGSKIFNVYGTKNKIVKTDTLAANTTLNYTMSSVPDVAGAFARSKERKELLLTVAGLNRATVLNGTITNAINWNDTNTKNTLRNNRVNFYVAYSPNFLAQDLVGATGNTSDVTVEERIGPSKLKQIVTQDVTQLGLKYLYNVNNQTTRQNLKSQISIYLDKYAANLVTTSTQIICDTTNNVDNSSTLNITLVLRPILAAESFVIDINLTA